MKILLVDDEFTSRLVLQEYLRPYGPTHVAVNGKEAVQAVQLALDADEPYALICLDIMMPEMDGLAALKEIRRLESERGTISSAGSKIFMTTALSDMKTVCQAYNALCEGYLVKPLARAAVVDALRKASLIA